jgi:lipopolysaccharide assembly outer membrane protein LptD (OstA)
MAVLSCGVVVVRLRSIARAVAAGLVLVACGANAVAQVPQTAPSTPASDVRIGAASRQERLGPHHTRLSGAAEIELTSQEVRFSADVIDYYADQHRLTAEGNVVFVTKSSRISADRAEFDTTAQTGTFFTAFGSASVSDKVDRSFFGGQEPDAFFYGETIEKIGKDKYRIKKGGFTTCVQPTPRWEVTAGTVTLTVDKRAVLTNAVLKVKDVPLFYVPAMYYPINKEDRSTGFLLPVYGTSTIRGSSISNAFFWAVNRSQDLTLMHDWFTKTGQGYGGEYRYVASSGSNGEFRMYRLNERATTFQQGGNSITQPARQSFEIRTNVVQGLPGGFRARGSVDYFSDVTVQQQYQMDLYNASLRTRNYQGNVSGSLGKGNSLSATYGINEIFYGDDDSQTIGGRPRVQFTRALTKLGALPLYFTGGAEYANIVRYDKSGDVKLNDQGLTRISASPSLQFPLTKWPFMSVRSSITWNNTYWTESVNTSRLQVPESVFRQYFDMRASATGPILTKVWNTPDNGYAERIKHVIEPEFVIQRTTQFEDYDRIVKIEGADYTFGGTTRVTYGVTNRFLARRRAGADGSPAPRVREFLNVQVQQSYYSDARASTVDGSYAGGFYGKTPTNFSPIAVSVRANPTNAVGASLRLEFDKQAGEFETIQANGTVNVGWLQTTGGWSQRKYLAIVNPLFRPPNNFLSSQTSVNIGKGHVGGLYHFDFNLSEHTLVQQRIGLFYNAQCCGVGIEYQAFNYPNVSRFIVPQDKRFNLSFTLAGVGSFSNILGAFGVGQGATGMSGGRRQ